MILKPIIDQYKKSDDFREFLEVIKKTIQLIHFQLKAFLLLHFQL